MRRVLLASLAASLACTGPAGRSSPGPAPSAAMDSGRPVVLFVGTSLTAGLGVDPEDAYPALLGHKMAAAGLDYRVVNAGVSGETSAGALRRIDWLLRQPVSVLVLETGANDGLRGQDPTQTRTNIQAILERARAQQPAPRLVLLGMRAPRNLGREYRDAFSQVYPDLSRRYDAVLVPFLLEGVAGVPSLNQADGLHPTPEGHARMAETVWPYMKPVLEEARRRTP